MTTTIKVTAHNYPAWVQVYDRVWDAEAQAMSADVKVTAEGVLKPADGERTFHCTTTREIRVTDLEYDDPRVV